MTSKRFCEKNIWKKSLKNDFCSVSVYFTIRIVFRGSSATPMGRSENQPLRPQTEGLANAFLAPRWTVLQNFQGKYFCNNIFYKKKTTAQFDIERRKSDDFHTSCMRFVLICNCICKISRFFLTTLRRSSCYSNCKTNGNQIL